MKPLDVVIDTDIGADPDDAIAVALAVASPELRVRGVTIVSGDVDWRGRIATRLLGMLGRPDIPVILALVRAGCSGSKGRACSIGSIVGRKRPCCSTRLPRTG